MFYIANMFRFLFVLFKFKDIRNTWIICKCHYPLFENFIS